MPLNIVLIEPEIPMNTGNIGRLSLASGSNLHLVQPLGFELSDKQLKRAGLDYWKYVRLKLYKSSSEFFSMHRGKNIVFFSSHGTQEYYEIDFTDEMFLVFGKESVGLGESILNANKQSTYRIPIFSKNVRSLNLANAVSVVVYEGIRKLGLK